MLDIRFIRENSEVVEKAIKDKLISFNLRALLSLDREYLSLLRDVEGLRAERNKISQEINRLISKKEETSIPKKAAIKLKFSEEAKKISQKIKEKEESLKEIKKKLQPLLYLVPNIPASDIPVGKNEKDNLFVREWGEKRRFDFSPLPHYEIGERLGILQFKKAAKICGSFFPLYFGLGAQIERALINFMLDFHKEKGYTEISPPFLANRQSMFNTGQIPKLENDMYYIPSEDLFLIPTAEVPLTNLHQDEIIPEEKLPLCYTAYTPCFRREAGAYGKETKGLLRVHQFDKVELVKFVAPEDSYAELESLVKDAEDVLQRLNIPYRVMLLCTGELSFASSKCYDLEVWAPGVEKYLEVSSCSNFLDFQARRGKVRLRRKNGGVEYLHTLNGSGVALARTLAAILENNQKKDGSVKIPEVLQPYLNGLSLIKPI